MLNNKELEKRLIYNNIIENIKSKYDLQFENNIQTNNILSVKYTLVETYISGQPKDLWFWNKMWNDIIIPIENNSNNNYYLTIIYENNIVKPNKYIIETNDFNTGLHYGNPTIFKILFHNIDLLQKYVCINENFTRNRK